MPAAHPASRHTPLILLAAFGPCFSFPLFASWTSSTFLPTRQTSTAFLRTDCFAAALYRSSCCSFLSILHLLVVTTVLLCVILIATCSECVLAHRVSTLESATELASAVINCAESSSASHDATARHPALAVAAASRCPRGGCLHRYTWAFVAAAAGRGCTLLCCRRCRRCTLLCTLGCISAVLLYRPCGERLAQHIQRTLHGTAEQPLNRKISPTGAPHLNAVQCYYAAGLETPTQRTGTASASATSRSTPRPPSTPVPRSWPSPLFASRLQTGGERRWVWSGWHS